MRTKWLGKYFKLSEFLRSETAARLGKDIGVPPKEIIEELERLVHLVLDPLREEVNKPITIISGYRPLWLNTAVKGSKTSDHLTGRAADLIVADWTNAAICRLIRETRLPIKQCILEFPPNGWVHVSIDRPGVFPKQEFLTAKKVAGKTVYVKGIKA